MSSAKSDKFCKHCKKFQGSYHIERGTLLCDSGYCKLHRISREPRSQACNQYEQHSVLIVEEGGR